MLNWPIGFLLCSPLPLLSLTGYRPFVEACIDADEKGEALKYIPKLSDPEDRAKVNIVKIFINFCGSYLVLVAWRGHRSCMKYLEKCWHQLHQHLPRWGKWKPKRTCEVTNLKKLVQTMKKFEILVEDRFSVVCLSCSCLLSLLWHKYILCIDKQAYVRIGMAKEAADAASQSKDNELLGRLKSTFSQNAAASSIFDTFRDRLSFQGIS